MIMPASLSNSNCVKSKVLKYLLRYKLQLSQSRNQLQLGQAVDIVKVNKSAFQKISKRYLLKDIENSYHEVTHIGLEPYQYFSFQNFSTNTVARDIKSQGQNGLWLAGCLSNSRNIFVKFAKSNDEQMLKISRRYLDSCLSQSKMTKNLLQPMAS